jgi:tRNA/tmRNA/rRNA uracil-C5-methylase (TrmA/RlmC/RlmD family)
VLGQVVDIEVERVAHGGHCVGRLDGRIVFIRHALPGERVRVRITGVEKSYLRGDAIEVRSASADRVEPPCPLAHADGCGGCDFQHASLPAQRQLKAAVIGEQLRRLAGIERDVVVEEVLPTTHWRTRMQFVTLPGGNRGLHKHHSSTVIEVDRCLIEAPGALDAATASGTVTQTVLGHSFEVAANGFWQVHPEAPRLLTETVLAMLAPQAGERAVDLYAGVGLFTSFLAEAVGPGGRVASIEGDRTASRHAQANLARFGHVEVIHSPVERAPLGPADVVVLDPPRSGAKRKLVEAIANTGARAIVYVACDPAALARDLGYFAEYGYTLRELRAFDLFPMTHHVETVALVEPAAR